jgi:prolyl oligopeptidase PreP (S9A serine peptidase family)
MTPQEKQDLIKHERWQTRIIDIMALTLIAQGIGEHVIEGENNVEWGKTKILISAALGISGWAAGELCESIYKKVYKLLKRQTLRQAMGQVKVGNITIDCQRSLRRFISIVLLLAGLYVVSQHPDIFSPEN